MKKIVQQFLTLNFLCFLFLGHSAYSAESNAYENVKNASEALEVIQGSNDETTILISPVIFERGKKNIKINRGRKDEILQIGTSVKKKWSNIYESNYGHVDFAKKPANMSLEDFFYEHQWANIIEFSTKSGTYELRIHVKKKEVKLIGLRGSKFTCRTLSDGSTLILLDADSLDAQEFFSITL